MKQTTPESTLTRFKRTVGKLFGVISNKQLHNTFATETKKFVKDMLSIRQGVHDMDKNNYALAVSHFVKGNFADVRLRLWMLKKLGKNAFPIEGNFLLGASLFFENKYRAAIEPLNIYLQSTHQDHRNEAKYLMAIIERDESKINEIPLEFIRIKFDSLATAFDETLNNLNDKSEQFLMFSLLSENITQSFPLNKRLDIVDLGCGTGILGRFLIIEDKINFISGVDLSPNMLEITANYRLNEAFVYDYLELNTIDNFLTNSKETYELAIMLGSTNYIKDLAVTLALVNKVLKDNAMIIISFKSTERQKCIFEFNEQVFLHNYDYVKSLLTAHGFTITTEETFSTVANKKTCCIIATRAAA